MSWISPLLCLTRGGVLGTALLPLLYAGWPGWASALLPPLLFPAVTLRAVVFRGLVQVAFAAWVVLAALAPRYRPRWSVTSVALVVFVAVVAVADVLGADPQRSICSNFERMEGLVGLVHVAAFFAVARAVLDEPRHWRAFALLSLAVAVAVALFAVAQWLAFVRGVSLPTWLSEVHSAPDHPRYFRADACLGSPIYLAVYLQFHVFWAAQLGVRASRWSGRVAAVAVIVLLAFAIYLTGTRVSWLAIVVGGGVAVGIAFAGGVRHRRAAVAVAAVVLGLGLGLGVLLLWQPAFLADVPGLERLRWTGATLGRRGVLWQQALQGVGERPLGWGQENFGFVADAHYRSELYLEASWWDQPHNVFLGWFVAGGVLGGLAYVALFAAPWWCLWRRRAISTTDRALTSGMLVAYAIYNSVQFDNLISYLMFGATLAWLDGQAQPPRVGAPRDAAWRRAAWFGVGAFAVVSSAVGFAYVTLPAWRGAAALHELFVVAERSRQVRMGMLPRRAGDEREALAIAERALAAAGLGRSEARELLAELADQLRGDPGTPPDVRDRVLELASRELLAEANERPPQARILFLTARLLLARGQPATARAVLERALQLAPGKPVLVHELAQAHFAAGNVEAGLATLRDLHERQPDDAETTLVYAVALLRADRFDPVEALLRQLYRGQDRGPLEFPDVRLVQALVEKRQLRLLEFHLAALAGEADALLRAARIDQRQAVKRYSLLAQAQADGGQFEAAIATLRRAIAADPNFAARANEWIEALRRSPAPPHRK